MTVNTTISRTVANGDGASLGFPVPFYFLQDDDLLVYVGGTLQTLTTNYTVSGAGNAAGGSVTFTAAPPAGSGNVVIIRDPDLLQGTKYPPNDPFPAQSHETALDKLTMLVQRARDLIARSFTFADSDSSAASLTVPTPQGGFLIGWNAAGNGLANYAGTGDGGLLPLPVPVADGGTGASDVAAARGNLGAAGLGDNNTWTGTQTVRDSKFLITDDVDTSKKVMFEASGISAGNTRTLVVPNKSGTFALLADIPSVAVPVRNTVMSGPQNINGTPNFGGVIGSTSVQMSGTIVANAMAGIGLQGALALIGSGTNLQWTGLSVNGTMYLNGQIANGLITPVVRTLKPIEQWGGSPSNTAGQLTFDVLNEVAYLGNGSASAQVFEFPLGEVMVVAGVVTAIVWYALNARYRVSGLAVPAPTSNTAIPHNLGSSVNFMKAESRAIFVAVTAGYAIGSAVPISTNMDNTGKSVTEWRSFDTGTSMSIVTNGFGITIPSSHGGAGGYTNIPAGSGTATLIVDVARGWGGA